MDENALKWIATYGDFWLGLLDEQPLDTDRDVYITFTKDENGLMAHLKIGETNIIAIPFAALEHVLSLAQYVGEQDGELGVAE